MGLEVGDFGVAEAVGEGGVWVDFLLALGERAGRGCCEGLFVNELFWGRLLPLFWCWCFARR